MTPVQYGHTMVKDINIVTTRNKYAAKVLGKQNVRQGFYGQEINLTTYNLCRINMFLHDINYEKFNIDLPFYFLAF